MCVMASTRHSNKIFLIGLHETNPVITLNQLLTKSSTALSAAHEGC